MGGVSHSIKALGSFSNKNVRNKDREKDKPRIEEKYAFSYADRNRWTLNMTTATATRKEEVKDRGEPTPGSRFLTQSRGKDQRRKVLEGGVPE